MSDPVKHSGRHASIRPIPGGSMNTVRVSAIAIALALGVGLGAIVARVTGAAAQAPIARALTPADTVAVRAIGEFAIAPNGTSVLSTIARSTAQTNRIDTALMLIRSGQSAAIELHVPAQGVNTMRWAPDSKRI